MPKPFRTGYMLHFKKRFLSRNWKEAYVELYSNSIFAWFEDFRKNEPEGHLCVRNRPDLFAARQFALRLPGRPPLPKGNSWKLLIALAEKEEGKINWFLCKTEVDFNEWMAAIVSTLPLSPYQVIKRRVEQQECPQLPAPPARKCRHVCLAGSHAGETRSCEVTEESPRPVVGFASGVILGGLLTTVSWGGWGLGYGWEGPASPPVAPFAADLDYHHHQHVAAAPAFAVGGEAPGNYTSPYDGGVSDYYGQWDMDCGGMDFGGGAL